MLSFSKDAWCTFCQFNKKQRTSTIQRYGSLKVTFGNQAKVKAKAKVAVQGSDCFLHEVDNS